MGGWFLGTGSPRGLRSARRLPLDSSSAGRALKRPTTFGPVCSVTARCPCRREFLLGETMNDRPDPVALLEQLAAQVSQRVPNRASMAEVWALTGLIERILVERPEYIAAFGAETRALFIACRTAALEGFAGGRVQ
jgi:hypothetical protein